MVIVVAKAFLEISLHAKKLPLEVSECSVKSHGKEWRLIKFNLPEPKV